MGFNPVKNYSICLHMKVDVTGSSHCFIHFYDCLSNHDHETTNQ